jgi:TPP-dependent pyruvate/acetoin dehydrogenase alpha subunit
VLAVYEVTRQALERARRGGGPTLIEADTMRMRGHAEHDDMKYVPASLLEEWSRKDPILRFETNLLERGMATPADLAAITAEVDAALTADVAAAEASPMPDPGSGLDGVYGDRPTASPIPAVVADQSRRGTS